MIKTVGRAKSLTPFQKASLVEEAAHLRGNVSLNHNKALRRFAEKSLKIKISDKVLKDLLGGKEIKRLAEQQTNGHNGHNGYNGHNGNGDVAVNGRKSKKDRKRSSIRK